MKFSGSRLRGKKRLLDKKARFDVFFFDKLVDF